MIYKINGKSGGAGAQPGEPLQGAVNELSTDRKKRRQSHGTKGQAGAGKAVSEETEDGADQTQ